MKPYCCTVPDVLLTLTALWSALAVALGQGPSGGQESLEQSCQEVIACSDPLDVLSSDKQELSAVASKEDMDRLCPDIKQHLECIDRRTKRCMAPELQMAFNVLYNGTIVFMTELCHNDTYQQEFLKHARCFNELKNSGDCEAKYTESLAEIQQNYQSHDAVQRICCSFQNYLECSKLTVGAVCGHEAGEFNEKMLDTMSISFKGQCQQVSVAESTCRALGLASSTPSGGSTSPRPPHPLLLALAALPTLLLRPRPRPPLAA